MKFTDGSIYIGSLDINGTINGHGSKTWKNGEKYIGEWRDGKMNGRGIFTWLNGVKYDGELRDDNKSGHGTFFW